LGIYTYIHKDSVENPEYKKITDEIEHLQTKTKTLDISRDIRMLKRMKNDTPQYLKNINVFDTNCIRDTPFSANSIISKVAWTKKIDVYVMLSV
jgi:hypothetical protein